MMDFGAIGRMGETLQKAADDIDRRLASTENLMRKQNLLTALLISELYAQRTGHPADIESVLARAEAIDSGTIIVPAPDLALGDHYVGMPGDVPAVPIEHSGKLPDVDWSDEK